MPKLNRYHPYTRQASLPPVVSPRYPAPPTLRLPSLSLPPISEQHSHNPNTQPYQTIHPDYIRGITSDGKTLIARSIMQGPDGLFHIKMEVVRLPSPINGIRSGGEQGIVTNPRLVRAGVQRREWEGVHTSCIEASRLVGGGMEFANQVDSGSDRRHSEEHGDNEVAVVTEDEDEDEEGDAEGGEYRGIMGGSMRQSDLRDIRAA